MLPFARASVIGLGLIGSSIARAVRQAMPTVRLTGHDADLMILCVPVGAIAAVAADLPTDVVVSGVGSSKAGARVRHPPRRGRPRPPVAGTERSGPEAGFATLFRGRWRILAPTEASSPQAVERMDPEYHGRARTVTSPVPHLPNLIA